MPQVASPRPGSAGNPRTCRRAVDATAPAEAHPPSQREEHRIDWAPSLGTSGRASPVTGPVGFPQKREPASLRLARGGSPRRPSVASPPSGWASADPSPPAASAGFVAGSSHPWLLAVERPADGVRALALLQVASHQADPAALLRAHAGVTRQPGLP